MRSADALVGWLGGALAASTLPTWTLVLDGHEARADKPRAPDYRLPITDYRFSPAPSRATITSRRRSAITSFGAFAMRVTDPSRAMTITSF
jgi:hypothetical protein